MGGRLLRGEAPTCTGRRYRSFRAHEGKLSLDECMHERMDGYVDRWDTVSTTVRDHRACAGCLEQGGSMAMAFEPSRQRI